MDQKKHTSVVNVLTLSQRKLRIFQNKDTARHYAISAKERGKKGNRLQLPFLGGSYWNGSGAGVFALNINEPRSNVNSGRGFRSALPSSQMPGPCGVRVSAGG